MNYEERKLRSLGKQQGSSTNALSPWFIDRTYISLLGSVKNILNTKNNLYTGKLLLKNATTFKIKNDNVKLGIILYKACNKFKVLSYVFIYLGTFSVISGLVGCTQVSVQ